MPFDMMFVFAVLAVTVVLFLTDKIRLDLIALGVVLVLALSNILTVREALKGFGEPLVVMIAGLFVVGEGLFRTGVAAAVGQWIVRLGGASELRLLVLLMSAVAFMSAFMSSTGAVALFIPVVLSLARKAKLAPAKLMMPLAFGSLIGGMMTLIGTPPNMVASSALERAGLKAFGFFEFSPIGGVLLIAGVAYMAFIGRHLLPGNKGEDTSREQETLAHLAERYGIQDDLHCLRVTKNSPLVGKTVIEAGMRSIHGVTVIGLSRKGRVQTSILPVLVETVIEAGDDLFCVANAEACSKLQAFAALENIGLPQELLSKVRKNFGLAEVMVTPRSRFIGRSIKELEFRERFGLSVLEIRHSNGNIAADYRDSRLDVGDTLLIAGGWSQITAMIKERNNFLVLDLPSEFEDVAPNAARAPVALLVMAAMLVLMTTGLVSTTLAVIAAALAMVASRCVTMDQAYKSMNWQSLVLIAGMLPLSTALQKTGGAQLIVDTLVAEVGGYGPMGLLAGLFVLTSLLSQFTSNTATTVLVAPIALAAAQQMGVAPQAFLMTVAIAASTAFATPVASPVNTLVLGPGGYKFIDFMKVGIPLQILCMILTLLLVPLFFSMAG